MDIVILLLFTSLIHKRAKEAGEMPFRWVLRYAMIWLLISTASTYLMTLIWPMDFSQFNLMNPDPEMLLPLAIAGIVSLGLCTIAFLFIYRKLGQISDEQEPEEEEPEKDLSYFR